jgi:hypothetical protein
VRFLSAWHDGAWSIFFRHDLPAAIRAQLVALAPEVAFADPARVRAILDFSDVFATVLRHGAPCCP